MCISTQSGKPTRQAFWFDQTVEENGQTGRLDGLKIATRLSIGVVREINRTASFFKWKGSKFLSCPALGTTRAKMRSASVWLKLLSSVSVW